jgi:hypothetical protein
VSFLVHLLFDVLQALVEGLFSPPRARLILLALCLSVIAGSGVWTWVLFHR